MNRAQKIYLDLRSTTVGTVTAEQLAGAVLGLDADTELQWGPVDVSGRCAPTALDPSGFVPVPHDAVALLAALSLQADRSQLSDNPELARTVEHSNDILARGVLDELRARVLHEQTTAQLHRLSLHRRQVEWATYHHLITGRNHDDARLTAERVRDLPPRLQWEAFAMLTLSRDGLLPESCWYDAFTHVRHACGEDGYTALRRLLRCDELGAMLFAYRSGVPALGGLELIDAVQDLTLFAADPLRWILAGADRDMRFRRATQMPVGYAAQQLHHSGTLCGPEPIRAAKLTDRQQVLNAGWVWVNHHRPTVMLATVLGGLNHGLRRLIRCCLTWEGVDDDKRQALTEALLLTR